ncbi:hypothetical protein OEB99_19135 [Actinotalea sp. M2MS4P-6]|uniref:hypothetical protein n=1 Tax=Actinotalea sp. M2MS4P-6 TaxID=2983762 RepID=UPI0021E36DB5|nr:hypothetical protein [Actinotalea sp. M2MS4P-6]MCV2396431.1 hypothetical protein [Actinotalea sp. M2MS4P-6]
MWIPLAVLVAALAFVLGGWAGLRTVRNQPVIWRQMLAGGGVEVVLLVQAVSCVVVALAGPGPADPPTFWGYLITTLLVLPVAGAWAFAERTRWSSVVLLVASVTVAFLQLRMVQVWFG